MNRQSVENHHSYSESEYRTFLEDVNLNVPFTQSIDTLSGGEKQRLAIACALCKNTDIMILDEPTSFLDENNELLIYEILKNLVRKYRKTVILSSHSPLATDVADEILEIEDHKIKEIRHFTEEDHEIDYDQKRPLSTRFYIDYGELPTTYDY